MSKELTIHDIKTGDSASFTKTISEEVVNAFAEITGDFNPLHIDLEYAAKSRFGGRISHGAILAGLISTVVGMKLPGPGALYASQSLNFLKPVFIGDTITASVVVTIRVEERNRIVLKTSCTNQHGEEVAEGKSILLPSKPKK
ncbi:MAG: MaoC family dehydratase [Balneolia bacterium]|nr:MaoC family dehydratase [Balneolia bacterium]